MSPSLPDLTAIAARHGCRTGGETELPKLSIWTAHAPTAPVPALFAPKFYLLLQGAKRMDIEGRTLEVRPGHCAVTSVGLPFTSEVIEASVTTPYVGIEIRLDAATISDLPSRADHPSETAGAFSFAEVTADVLEPLGRLLGLLDAPDDIPVLAEQYEREVWYRLLQGALGQRIRQSAGETTRFGQIRKATEWIANHAHEPLNVDWLATHVGMSTTSFYRHFRAVTSDTPLSYRRRLRLLDARRCILSGARVTDTAFAVGYGSSSQFSREYKRTFGASPASDRPIAAVDRTQA